MNQICSVSGQINEENILKRMLRIILVAIIFGQMIALHAQQPLDIYGGCINIKGAMDQCGRF
ncbi:MAG: hypothetical protein AMS26_23920 [Bacteroides sp. SM23_62]|nr:MAG: hypothetical protein AMS26_23920 [Bacteroides sp. SM23_62]